MPALPSRSLLSANYPAFDARTVAQVVGGKVKLNYDMGVFSNFFAIRVSRALSLSGHLVPYMKGETSSGAHGRWHIYRVKRLKSYLTEHYGRPEELGGDTFKDKLDGKHGIVVFDVAIWTDASGHADLWNGSKCLWKGYGDVSNRVWFWPAS